MAYTMIEFIKKLYALGERQFEKEQQAAVLIRKELEAYHVPYRTEHFTMNLPRFKKAELSVDGHTIPCVATSLVSGKITSPNPLISSLTSSQNFLHNSNINFNQLCRSISRSNHYFAPSVAVHAHDVKHFLGAESVQGTVIVHKVRHTATNILVGNSKNPRYVVFSHFDSLYGGAVDNASGTALSLYLATQHKELLAHTLFVFSGNEELSYDEPIYWGHGYRVFEAKHGSALKRAKHIFVIDCIGFSKTNFVRDQKVVILGFPVKSLSTIINKTTLVIGDYQKMMTFYHSDLDTPELITEAEMRRAAQAMIKKLS